MGLTVTPLHPTIGAEIGGVDLRRPVPPDAFAEIEAAFNRHAVLVFPDQRLSDAEQIAFSTLFGPLELNPNYADEERRIADRAIADISNLDERGEIHAAEDRRRMFNRGNQLWHTDSSFKHVPAKCSLHSAREIPLEGGDTEFADLRAAYDALPEGKKRAIEGLIVEHSIFRSRSQIGFADFNGEIFKQLPPVEQMLVRIHPGSLRKTLPRLACLARPRPADRGGKSAHRGADRVCDRAAIRLPAPLARRRSRDLGQSLHHASRPAL